MISIDELREIMRAAPVERLERFVEPLGAAMAEFEIEGVGREAMFLANLAHESGEFRYMHELADGSAYDDRADLGNTRPEAIAAAEARGTTPGRLYRGHGPIQITGYDNHLEMGEALGLDLVNHPELLEEPGPGCRSAARFWRHAKLRDGTRVDLNPIADAGDFRGVCLVINRGLLRSERDPLGWAQREEYYDRARAAYAARRSEED